MRQYRLPTGTALKHMSVKELKSCLEGFEDWYSMHEEEMTFDFADRQLARIKSLEEYIKEREVEEK